MRMGDELLNEFYTNGQNIRRTSWPKGDYICTDGAEGGTIWYCTAEEDEFTPDYKLGFHDLGTDEWEVYEYVIETQDQAEGLRE